MGLDLRHPFTLFALHNHHLTAPFDDIERRHDTNIDKAEDFGRKRR